MQLTKSAPRRANARGHDTGRLVPMPAKRTAKAKCSIEGCDRDVTARGWCGLHYSRWQRHGDPMTVIVPRRRWPPPEERFWAATNKRGPAECWEWQATRTSAGYGHFHVSGRLVSSHRFAYELLVGPIPEGLELDHLCRNPACVNPAHLEPVTHSENILRGVGPVAENARKTHCPRGHPFTADDVTIRDGRVHRKCLICARATALRSYYRRKAS